MSKMTVFRPYAIASTLIGAVAISPLANAAGGSLGVGLGAGVTSASSDFKGTMIAVLGGLIAGIIITALGIRAFRWAKSTIIDLKSFN